MYDLGSDWAENNEHPPHTYRLGGVEEDMKNGSRLDTIIGNHPASLLVEAYQFVDEMSLGMDHFYIRTTLNIDKMDSTFRAPIRPEKLKLPEQAYRCADRKKEIDELHEDIFKEV